MNFRFRYGVAALIAAVVFSGCSKVSNGSAGGGRHPWTEPGVLRFSEFSDPKNLNPLLNSASPTLDLSMFVFSWTVRYDQKAESRAGRAPRDSDRGQR